MNNSLIKSNYRSVSELMPIEEESSNCSRLNETTVQYFQEAIVIGASSAKIPSKMLSMPRTSNKSGHINSAYDNLNENEEDLVNNNFSEQYLKVDDSNLIEYSKYWNSKNKRKDSLPGWDRFETLPDPDEDETQKSEWVEVAIKWLKLFAYLFTFIMVWILPVLSKTLMLLMTSMIANDHNVTICNNQNENFHFIPPLKHDKKYMVNYSKTSSRIPWLFALYFSIIAPYILAFGRSTRIVYFKRVNRPASLTMFIVWIAETLHCIGLSMLVFVILPKMNVIHGAMISNGVGCIPIFVRLLVKSSNFKTTLTNQQFQTTDENNNAMDSEDEDEEWDRRNKHRDSFHHYLASNRYFAWINFILQIIIIVSWTLFGYYNKFSQFYLIPIALILVSFEWWENYVVPNSMKNWFIFLSDAKNDLNNSRYFVYTIISIWKIFLISTLMLANEYFQNDKQIINDIFQNFTDNFSLHKIMVINDKRNYSSHILLESDYHIMYIYSNLWPLWILFIHVSISYLTYAFAKFTCKVYFQKISFAIPLCLTVPTTISLLWFIISVSIQDKCKLIEYYWPFQFIFWNQGSMDMFDLTITSHRFTNNILPFIIWLFSFINQITNTLHIWRETSECLASTEQLFVNPMYNSVLIDQSLVMNRRCLKLPFLRHDNNDKSFKNEIGQSNELKNVFDQSIKNEQFLKSFNSENIVSEIDLCCKNDSWKNDWHQVCQLMGIEEDSIDAKINSNDDETIRIYICATMWHEDENEMFQMLKAVMRLDYEQGIRRIAKQKFGKTGKLIYEMEVNIFFDDAFEQGKTNDEDDRKINRFVEQLINTIGGAANQVFCTNLDVKPPTVVPTPYGGKLIWKMPMGTNRLIAHIKDKDLIRHRKRWSQCMYMYYLLGYRLAAREDLSLERKKTIMSNTFILALDGDINFRPQAVDLVVDLMKKNNNLGAACGRIHPIGSGPIVWYQKFEYAMGHWLQKATEHVFGCVLCSPGCFSLFRAQALMDKSVMNKYTTKPSCARHYVQYDQGEDRWLCTLLLKRGWRIEYCAASDSYTHAPEGFGDFYIQRRRWGPSTMANILDILADYNQTVHNNDHISVLYIAYQAFLMLGTIISPGTIFLMVVSAMNTVMGISSQMALFYNAIPLLLFSLVCLKFKDNNYKILFATILSVIYALLMLAVLVGTFIQMFNQGILSPNSLFFSAMIISFIVAAIIHPQEIACVFPLPIYMLFIPSMYMLLTIYSITNMNVVSWGTREVKSKLSAKELARQKEEQASAAAKSKKKSNFLNFSNVGTKNGLFTCMCCYDSQQEELTETMHEMKNDIKEIFKDIKESNRQRLGSKINNDFISVNMDETSDIFESEFRNNLPINNEVECSSSNEKQKISPKNSSEESGKGFEQRDLKPRWIKNNTLLNSCPIKLIPTREKEFWEGLISKYLYPLDEDAKEKERISLELADLRTKFVFFFGFLNLIFILFVFILQLNKDVLGIDIPVGYNSTIEIYDPIEDRIYKETTYKTTRMDPINLTLVVCFGLILIIQCIGMFFHRFGTFAHLLAYTEIGGNGKALDYSSFVSNLIKEKNQRYRRVKCHKNNINQTASENSISDHADLVGESDSLNLHRRNDIKPSQYGDIIDKTIEELKCDQTRLDKMPKIIRKNTKRAIRKHELHKQHLIRRDSIASSLSVTLSDKNSKFYSINDKHRYQRLSKHQMSDGTAKTFPIDHEQSTKF